MISGRVKGKVVIVTGAASGVGREDALLLAREGARMVLTDLNEEGGRAVAKEIGADAMFVRHDISQEQDWQNVLRITQEKFGAPDVLVNNAAVLLMASVLETSLEQWQRVMRINADGYFLGCKYAVEAMQKRGGSIINMSSVAAIGGLPMFCAYSASKGAVTALTRNIAAYSRQNKLKLRCNSIHPDGILTPMIAAFVPPSPDGRPPVPGEGAAERMCDPKDVANLVLFLASDESRFINGSELRIDNGQMILGVA